MARTYFSLPLSTDEAWSGTLLRVEEADDGDVLVHLHQSKDDRAFGVRFGYSTPRPVPLPEPTRTLRFPSPEAPGLTGPESVLADAGRVLQMTSLGAGPDEIAPWPLEGLMPPDEWLLHVSVLAVSHERLAAVRTSGVDDDPRVVEAVARVVSGMEPHARALRGWVAQAVEVADAVVARLQAEIRERRVRETLRLLAGEEPEGRVGSG